MTLKFIMHLFARLIVPDQFRRLQLLCREEPQKIIVRGTVRCLELYFTRNDELYEKFFKDFGCEQLFDALVEVGQDA